MLSVDIEIPTPSRFVSDTEIDEIALAYCQADRAKSQGKSTFLLDLERFVDRLAGGKVDEKLAGWTSRDAEPDA